MNFLSRGAIDSHLSLSWVRGGCVRNDVVYRLQAIRKRIHSQLLVDRGGAETEASGPKRYGYESGTDADYRVMVSAVSDDAVSDGKALVWSSRAILFGFARNSRGHVHIF